MRRSRRSSSKLIPLGRPGPGFLTVHRVDPSVIKSPSVGLPLRTMTLVLGLALIGLAAVSIGDMMTSEGGVDRAMALLREGSEAIAGQSGFEIQPASSGGLN